MAAEKNREKQKRKKKIVLASTSEHRRRLLSRLQIPFVVAAPPDDEEVIPGEAPQLRALRLAECKARAVHSADPAGMKNAAIIGGDQTIADSQGALFGKPHTAARARAQLAEMSGKTLYFYTAVCVLDGGDCRLRVAEHRVVIRDLDAAEIRRYVRREPALNCAGGAQIEGLGISLLADIRGGDPTALIGMPLIALCEMLRKSGIEIP
jgi:septum formation protein